MNAGVDGIHPATLQDGRRLEVELASAAHAHDVIRVTLTERGATLAALDLPYPSRGVAGGVIVLSPSERYAVLSMYSGQSEERYDIFRIDGGLERIGGVPYQFGEVAGYCFSDDEALLVMALPALCSEWWTLVEDADREPGGRLSFTFATVFFHDVENDEVSIHRIRLSVPADWRADESDYEPDLHPRLVSGSRLLLTMPWGETDLALPLASVVTIAAGRDGFKVDSR